MLIKKNCDLLQQIYDQLEAKCAFESLTDFKNNHKRIENVILVKLGGQMRAKVWVKNPSEAEIIIISCNAGVIDRLSVVFSTVLNRKLEHFQYESQTLEALSDEDIANIADRIFDYLDFYRMV